MQFIQIYYDNPTYMMQARTYRLLGRSTLMRPADYQHLLAARAPMANTYNLLANRIETIRERGFPLSAQALNRQLEIAKTSPDGRMQLLIKTSEMLNGPFSAMEIVEDLIFKGDEFQGVAIATPEQRSEGMKKAAQLTRHEQRRIIKSQLETLFLAQKFGQDLKALEKYLLNHGVAINYDFTREEDALIGSLFSAVDSNDGFAEATQISFSTTKAKSIAWWSGVYFWRKIHNGVESLPGDDHDEIVLHALMHGVLDYGFLLFNRAEFGFDEEEHDHMQNSLIMGKLNLGRLIAQINHDYKLSLDLPPVLEREIARIDMHLQRPPITDLLE